jgi:hypothetical protein
MINIRELLDNNDYESIRNMDKEEFDNAMKEEHGISQDEYEVSYGKYYKEALDLCNAIRIFAENPDNLDNFECYIAHHFPVWLERWANSPEGLANEFNRFATM